MDNFAVFILTHGRAGNAKTYKTLRQCGYSGNIYLIVDDEDPDLEQYKKEYGKDVIVFDKGIAAEKTDSGDNIPRRDSVIYARNMCHKIAKDLDLDFFWELDDDYIGYYWSFNINNEYVTTQQKERIKKLDDVIKTCLAFFNKSNALSVAMAQGGDFIGGENSALAKTTKKGEFRRKAMNTFFMKTDRPFQFIGRMNDDVNTYVRKGNLGKLFVTIGQLRVQQAETQEQKGGLTEMYLSFGTYVKSFYTILYAPSCVDIRLMGTKHNRMHHFIHWNNTVPKILPNSARNY